MRINSVEEQSITDKQFLNSLGKIAFEMFMKGPFTNTAILDDKQINIVLGEIGKDVVLCAKQMFLLITANETSLRFSHSFFRNFLAFQYCLNTISSPVNLDGLERKLVYVTHALDFDYGEYKSEHYQQEIIKQCVEIIKDVKNRMLRFKAIAILSSLGDDATDTYYSLLTDPDSFVRFNALYALTMNIEPFTISILQNVLNSSSAEIKRQIAEHLAEIENDSRLIPILINIINDARNNDEINDDDWWDIANSAAIALISYGIEALPYFVSEITDPDLIELLKAGKESDLNQVLSILTKRIRENENVREELYLQILLCVLANGQTIFELADILLASQEHVSTIMWLIEQIAKRYPEPICDLLKNDDARLRILALEILKETIDENAIDLVLSTLEDTIPDLRLLAAQTLNCYGPDMLGILLKKAFDSPEEIYVYRTLSERASSIKSLDEWDRDTHSYKALFEKVMSELEIATNENVVGRKELLIVLLSMAGKTHSEGIPLMINALKTGNKNYQLSLKIAIWFVGKSAYDSLIAARDNKENKKIRKDIQELLGE